MSLLLETLKAVEGTLLHVNYHQRRLESSLQQLGLSIRHDLETAVKPPQHGVYRCRVVYDEKSMHIEYLPYHKRILKSLKIVEADTLEYPLKYADRSALNTLFQQRASCDDIAIIKNGYLTDTTIANIALYDGIRWYTPKQPLLYGTTRQRLLERQFLIEKDIAVTSIQHYKKYAVFNAMIGFVELEHGIIF